MRASFRESFLLTEALIRPSGTFSRLWREKARVFYDGVRAQFPRIALSRISRPSFSTISEAVSGVSMRTVSA